MIEIDLSKQEELGGDPKPKQQINFTVNPRSSGKTTMFSLL